MCPRRSGGGEKIVKSFSRSIFIIIVLVDCRWTSVTRVKMWNTIRIGCLRPHTHNTDYVIKRRRFFSFRRNLTIHRSTYYYESLLLMLFGSSRTRGVRYFHTKSPPHAVTRVCVGFVWYILLYVYWLETDGCGVGQVITAAILTPETVVIFVVNYVWSPEKLLFSSSLLRDIFSDLMCFWNAEPKYRTHSRMHTK